VQKTLHLTSNTKIGYTLKTYSHVLSPFFDLRPENEDLGAHTGQENKQNKKNKKKKRATLIIGLGIA